MFEFGGSVVRGEVVGQTAEDGEFADRQPVQAETEQVVGLLGVLDQFLQLVEDVAVEEPEKGTVDVQGISSAESGVRQQGENVLEGAQGATGPQAKRRGQGPGDQQRHHTRVSQRQPTEVAADGT